MNSVCITGYLPTDLSLVENILNQAGMQAALPAQRDTSMSISVWHQQVAELLAKENHDDQDELGAATNLGRLWEQLASDIFISNLHSPTWGWADTRSAPLLSFWKNFDPQLRFVLVVCSPERVLAHAIESSSDTPNVEQTLNKWQSYTETLLAFYKANPKRSIIVNVQDCIDQPAVFLQTLNKKWGLQLNKVHFPNIAAVGFSDLTKYLAAGLVGASPAHQELGIKLHKSSSLNSTEIRHNAIPSYANLIQWYRKVRGDVLQRGQDQLAFQTKHNKLLERFEQERAFSAQLAAQNVALEHKQKELALEIDSLRAEVLNLQHSTVNLQEESNKLKEINAEFDKALEEHDLQKAQLTETLNQLAAVQNAHEESKAALAAAKNEQDKQTTITDDLIAKLCAANSQLEASTSAEKTLTEESDLLLLQLHQVQEELESYFLQYQELKKEVESTQAQLTETQAQLAAAQSAREDSNATLADARNEQDRQSEIANDLWAKLATANSQLQESNAALTSVKNERDNQTAVARELTAALTEANLRTEASIAALAAAKNEQQQQTSTTSDLEAKLSATHSQLEASASVEKELKEESELLLLQLHQVQEELEVYFLKYQETTKEVETSQARWRRMLVRNPDYCDVESIAIEPVAQDKTRRTIWTIKGLDAGGRHIPEMSFATFIEKGIAGFEFSRADNGSAGLLRWPTTLTEDTKLAIAMNGDIKASEKRALAIIGLATSDWSLINVLLNLLRKSLLSPSLLKAPQNFDAAALIKALDKLEINLKSLPEVLRYDKVKLKREQVNPDYEHLWFSFDNMKASGKLIGDFEYRISCTNVRPKKFGDHPKLEFPETCKTVFQSWFEESYDDYGAKLELRFAMPESMDMEVWGKLTPHDQLFIRDLVRQLPFVIEDLRLSGQTLKRSWDDWKFMIGESQRVLTMRAEPAKPTPKIRKASPRQSAV